MDNTSCNRNAFWFWSNHVRNEQVIICSNEIVKIDGLRVEYEHGFGLMRASNTTPSIVLRFEADSNKNLELIQNEFKEVLKSYISYEKIPF